MKKSCKALMTVLIATVSLCNLSAMAAKMPEKIGSMPLHTTNAEMKFGINMNNGTFGNLAPSDKKTSIAGIESNIINKGISDNMFGGMRDKGMRGERPEISEEDKESKIEEIKAELAAKLEADEITQDEYDKVVEAIENGKFMFGGMHDKGMRGERPEISEEDKETKIEEIKAELAAKLEAGEITQDEYDKAVEAIENGKLMFGGMHDKGMRGERPEMSEEDKKTKTEEIKAELAAKLEAGEITQDEYDKAVEAIENGKFMFGGICDKGMKREMPKTEADTTEV